MEARELTSSLLSLSCANTMILALLILSLACFIIFGLNVLHKTESMSKLGLTSPWYAFLNKFRDKQDDRYNIDICYASVPRGTLIQQFHPGTGQFQGSVVTSGTTFFYDSRDISGSYIRSLPPVQSSARLCVVSVNGIPTYGYLLRTMDYDTGSKLFPIRMRWLVHLHRHQVTSAGNSLGFIFSAQSGASLSSSSSTTVDRSMQGIIRTRGAIVNSL